MINVLYVDHDEAALENTKQYLESSSDMKVTTAASVIDAEKALSDHSFDAIISDYRMPVTDGLQFLHRVRAVDSRIPFILFTERTREDVIPEIYDLGISFFVQKGGDPEAQFIELEQKVRHAVEKRRAEDALGVSSERFRALVEDSPVATGLVRDGRFVHVNPAYARLMGYDSEEELVGSFLKDRIDPEYRGIHEERVALLMAGQDVSPSYESVMVKADGTRVPVLVSTSHLDLSTGRVTVAFLTDLTRRKRIEDELRTAKEEFENFFNLSLDLLVIADTDGYFRRINPGWEGMLGYTASELLERPFLDFVHPDDVEKTIQAAKDLEEQKDVLAFTNRYRCKDGTYRWIEWRSRPVGKLIYAAARDITERKRAEEELKESQQDLAMAQSVAQTGSWRLNVHTGGLEWSDETYRIFGIPIGTPMTLDNFTEVIHPEDRGLVVGRWKEALTGGPYDVEHRIVVDGEVKWVREKAILVSKEGKVIEGFGTVQDITDKKQTEEALQRSEQMLKMVMDHFPGVVFWKDRDLHYLGANRESARIAGFSDPSEYIGKTDYDLPWTKAQADAFRADDLEVMRSGQPKLHIIESQQRAGGETGWLDTSKVPLRDSNGNVIGILGTAQDITERKVAEDALHRANRQLNLLNSVTRHDMLNQLVVLSGYADLLEQSELNPRQTDMLKKMQRSIEILNSQLEFTKNYQEIGGKAPKWQNLHALVQGNMQNLTLGKLRVEEKGTDVWIMADPMMEKVVYNLIENVLRHSGGAKVLRITASVKDGRLTIIFEDDGRGIDKSDKKHLFEHGYGKNTGFGLFMSREILNITNISIRETSEQGKGARFEIEVPDETQFRLQAQ